MPPTFSDDLLEFWRERHLCSVTTLRADGSPHVVPMGIVLDAEHGRAWGITSRTSQKVANLLRGTDPRVAVNQVDGARKGLAHNVGGPTAVAAVTILEGPGG